MNNFKLAPSCFLYLFKISLLALVAVVMCTSTVLADITASAGSEEVFMKAKNKAAASFTNIRLIIFIIGGFGLVGLAFSAIFGKVQ